VVGPSRQDSEEGDARAIAALSCAYLVEVSAWSGRQAGMKGGCTDVFPDRGEREIMNIGVNSSQNTLTVLNILYDIQCTSHFVENRMSH
jgi:hypothetical protein